MVIAGYGVGYGEWRDGRSCRDDGLEVLDDRERVVEVVQKGAPLLVGIRAAEPLGVVLERFPLHEEQEGVGLLDTAGHAQRDEAGMIAFRSRGPCAILFK